MWFDRFDEEHKHVTVITPVLPAKTDFLQETAESIELARQAVGHVGWSLDWIVIADGPGSVQAHGVDRLIELPTHVGPSAARNSGLSHSKPGWILPLDGDDLIEPEGLVGLLSDPVLNEVGWVTTNRVFIDGTKTAYWRDSVKAWQRGELQENWFYPLPFHPNDFIARRDVYLAAGGWPAIEGAENTACSVLVAGISSGVSTTHVTTRYRRWEGQTTADPKFLKARELAYETVGAIVNARRRMEGKAVVNIPVPGNAVPGTTAYEDRDEL